MKIKRIQADFDNTACGFAVSANMYTILYKTISFVMYKKRDKIVVVLFTPSSVKWRIFERLFCFA